MNKNMKKTMTVLLIMILLLNLFVVVPISLTGSVEALNYSMDTDLSNVDASFIGEDKGDRSGCSVAGAGDVNGDGYDDILIGAIVNDAGGTWAGQTYLILGNASGWAMDTDLSNAEASFIGE